MCVAKQVLIGVDTPFLVAYTVLGHSGHRHAREQCERVLRENYLLALCPTVMDEFIHVVTDTRRFEQPLEMAEALEAAENLLNSRETVNLFPRDRSIGLYLRWLHDHRLGRKRINDTRIASIYHHHGIRHLLTSKVRDYTIFDCFAVIELEE